MMMLMVLDDDDDDNNKNNRRINTKTRKKPNQNTGQNIVLIKKKENVKTPNVNIVFGVFIRSLLVFDLVWLFDCCWLLLLLLFGYLV